MARRLTKTRKIVLLGAEQIDDDEHQKFLNDLAELKDEPTEHRPTLAAMAVALCQMKGTCKWEVTGEILASMYPDNSIQWKRLGTGEEHAVDNLEDFYRDTNTDASQWPILNS